MVFMKYWGHSLCVMCLSFVYIFPSVLTFGFMQSCGRGLS